MSAGLTTWWATPADPRHHFSAEDLEVSERYHRPVRSAGAAAIVLRFFLVVMAAFLAAGLTEFGTGPVGKAEAVGESWLGAAGFFETLFSRSLLVGAGLTTLALRIPAITVDAWFEYRFRHGAPASESFEPLPVKRFVITVGLLAALTFVAVLVVGVAVYRLAATSMNWQWTVTVAVVLLVVLATMVEGPIRQRLPGRGSALGPSPVRFEQLLDRFKLQGMPVLVRNSADGVKQPMQHHFNASAAGVGPNRRIVVAEGLLAESKALQEFVVAHELSHHKRHHVAIQTAVTAGALIVSVHFIALIASEGWLFDRFAINLFDPMHLPAVAALLLLFGALAGPLVAWLGRAHERIADADAIKVVGPLPADLLWQLHSQSSADLDPPWWVRISGQHPSPAERLEFVKRHRR